MINILIEIDICRMWQLGKVNIRSYVRNRNYASLHLYSTNVFLIFSIILIYSLTRNSKSKQALRFHNNFACLSLKHRPTITRLIWSISSNVHLHIHVRKWIKHQNNNNSKVIFNIVLEIVSINLRTTIINPTR
jgi:hypothetical protein